jgi:hypothetical protein
LPVDSNPSEPGGISKPAPDNPEEPPDLPEVEESSQQEDGLDEDRSGDPVSTVPDTSAGKDSSPPGFVTHVPRRFEHRAAGDPQVDVEADLDLEGILGGLFETETPWYESLPRMLADYPDSQRNAFEILTIQAFEFLQDSLDGLKQEADGESAFNQAVVSAAIALSTGLSVGYVVWLLRSGMLLTPLLSSMPAWRFLDPLPILAGKRDDSDGEEADESLETIVEGSPHTRSNKDNDDPS